ncbi:GTP-binding protein [Alphaproteobacteria bacterium]|nr:GTP-binding protein [Alphaproteobacteria bacterium]
MKTMNIKNIAIIAHVDHGKTTLVDTLLAQSGAFGAHQQVQERVMDSNDLERERGITILAKCTSVAWKGSRINIVDTPGHADFGGEVERIMSMVDGVLLLVDAAEGPLPQTKFVLGKALKLGIRPIVVINKVDRPDARSDAVLDEVFDLFVSLGATDAQLDFPIAYASGREGWAALSLTDPHKDITPLFDLIIDNVPDPVCYPDRPFSLLATTLEYDAFVGRLLTGKILSGRVRVGQPVKAMSRDGKLIEQTKITKIMAFRDIQRKAIDEAEAGDIVTIAGFSSATVADTLCALEVSEAIPSQPIDPPTLSMAFSVNDSPLAGRDGKKVTSRLIADRLKREAEGNVALKINFTAGSDNFEVAGRGELQLGILIETMRREGFELSVGTPRVILREGENGQKLEPFEEVVVDVDDAYSGTVVSRLSARKGELLEMIPSEGGKTRLIFKAPSRGLIGYHSQFLTDTSGTGILNRLFTGYAPYKGAIGSRKNGVLISMDSGTAVPYALDKVQERGVLFINPGEDVYAGMIVGENAKDNDIEVNPVREKHLTNIRAAGKDDAISLVPPRKMSLEEALTYIADDEIVEITPKTIRLRKKILDANERKKQGRKG